MKFITNLLLVVQTCIVLTGTTTSDEKICNRAVRGTCHHNASYLCEQHSKWDFSCAHQLDLPEAREMCTVKYVDADDCQMTGEVKTYDYNNLPFSLTMYRLSTWLVNKTLFNLSFTNPEWSHLGFQYRHQDADLAARELKKLCRRFELSSKSATSKSDTLFWDCDFFDETNYYNNSYVLLLRDSEGSGGDYSFRIPDVDRIDRSDTSIEDWQVFQFLHSNYFHLKKGFPVTIQLAPFDKVFYNVTLVQCLDPDEDQCAQRQPIDHKVIKGPSSIETVEGQDEHRTVMFEYPNKEGRFAVVVQIVEAGGQCLKECFSSISPIFELKPDSWLQVTIYFATVLLGVFLLGKWFAWKHRVRVKEIIQKRQQHKKSVLLVYSVTFTAYLDFIKELAHYLQQRCHVRPLYVDQDPTGQDPSEWIEEMMRTSAKVLFFVSNPLRGAEGTDVTPIRDQWSYALSYYSEFYWRDNFNTIKFAVVTFPFSASVPRQIAHLRRFHLMEDLTLLITWIHNGSILENYLLWGPLLSIMRPVRREKNELKSMVTAITREMETMPATIPINDTTITVPDVQKNHVCQGRKDHLSEDLSSVDSSNAAELCTADSVADFDEAVPKLEELPIFGEVPRAQCTMGSAHMDPAVANAFFGV